MSTKATFYILKTISSPKETALYICRIIEKAYNNGLKIYIYTTSQNEAENFDKQLWTFKDISFITHEIYTKDNNTDIQILIGCTEPPDIQDDILINLTSEVPPFHKQFDRIIEVVSNDENLKASGRSRFQSYKNMGYKMDLFEV